MFLALPLLTHRNEVIGMLNHAQVFYTGAGNLNSHPHAYTANFPSYWVIFLALKVLFSLPLMGIWAITYKNWLKCLKSISFSPLVNPCPSHLAKNLLTEANLQGTPMLNGANLFIKYQWLITSLSLPSVGNFPWRASLLVYTGQYTSVLGSEVGYICYSRLFFSSSNQKWHPAKQLTSSKQTNKNPTALPYLSMSLDSQPSGSGFPLS